MFESRQDSRAVRPDRHEVRGGPDGLVTGLHLGRAYAINARGAFNGSGRRVLPRGGFLAHDLEGRARLPAPGEREDARGPSPSALLAFLEREEPTASSRAAAAAIRAMAGPLAESRAVDAVLPVWGFHDASALARLAPEARDRLAAEAAVLGRAMPWGRARPEAMDYLRRAVPADPLVPVGEARLRRLLAAGRPFSGEAELRAVLSLPEDWTPRVPCESAALTALAEGYARLADALGGYGFLAFARGRYVEAVARLHPDGVPPGADGDALDLVDAFHGQIARPALIRLGLVRPGLDVRAADAPTRRIAARVLLGGKGLPAILEAARRWHASPLSRLPDVPNLAWGAPGPDLLAPNGLTLAWLTSSAQLAAEGGRLVEGGLQHCVASYAGRCAAGETAILSIRNGHTRLSTVEVALPQGMHEPRVAAVQHRGARNLAPPEGAREALAWFLDAAARGTVRLVPPLPGAPSDDLAGCEEAARAWAFLLIRPARTASGLDHALIEAADAVVRTRFPGGWAALPAGRILPEAGTLWSGASAPAHPPRTLHPASGAAEILALLQALTGRLAPSGTPSNLAASLAAGLCLTGFGAYTTLFHLCLSLRAIHEGAPAVLVDETGLGPAAIVLSALVAAGIALAMPIAFLAAGAYLARRIGARSLRGRIAAARRHVRAGGAKLS